MSSGQPSSLSPIGSFGFQSGGIQRFVGQLAFTIRAKISVSVIERRKKNTHPMTNNFATGSSFLLSLSYISLGKKKKKRAVTAIMENLLVLFLISHSTQ
jgi:hypothetical protein